jgi:type II secretory pathway component GspD/PulD (secretin)
MTLRVRPSITPENKVNMIANVELSQLKDELVNDQPVTSMMQTTTNMIVGDGQTLMLGGILFQRDTLNMRKIPGLGDLLLIGGLFRHKEMVKANSELIIFMTPYVVDEDDSWSSHTLAEVETSRRRLSEVRRALEESLATLRDGDEKEDR